MIIFKEYINIGSSSLIVLFIGIMIGLFIRKIIYSILSKFKSYEVDFALKHSKRIWFFLLLTAFSYALSYAANLLHLKRNIVKTIDSLTIIFAFYAGILFVNSLLLMWFYFIDLRDNSKKRVPSKSRYDVVIKIIDGVLWFICFIVVLNIWEIKITAFLTGLGIAGIVIGLALQSTLGDFFSGIALMGDHPFKIGDVVQIDDVFGIVYDINFRSIKIKTYDNEIVIFPNSKVASSKIINHTALSPRRFVVDFGVEYGTDIDKAKKTALKALEGIPEVIKEPAPFVYFLDFGEYALKFKLIGWVKTYDDLWNVKEKIRMNLYKEFNKAGIKFAFPTSKVYLKK
ncbi:MAG: mechanosensitive ion channel family protein [Candidatus Woesearchaeota archaeon]